MNAKDYLRQYENLQRKIRIINDRIEALEDEADCVKSLSDNDGQPHGSNIGNPTSEWAIRITDEKLKRIDLMEKAYDKGKEILDTISKVDGVEQEVLYLRYIKLMKWEEITIKIGYSWKHTHRFHKYGLMKISKILEIAIE